MGLSSEVWLSTAVPQELKIGLSENSVFGVFHPDAIDLFSVSSSLEKVCHTNSHMVLISLSGMH